MLPCDDGCSLFLKSTVMVKCEQRERERACTIYFKLEPSNQTKAGFKFGKMFVLLLVENVVLINQSIDTHSRKKKLLAHILMLISPWLK